MVAIQMPNIMVSEGGEAAAAAAARRRKRDKTSNNYRPSNHWTGPPAERGEKNSQEARGREREERDERGRAAPIGCWAQRVPQVIGHATGTDG